MLVKIGNTAVSPKEVSTVYYSQTGVVFIGPLDGTSVEESIISAGMAETHKNIFIDQVNNALRGYW